ncbi:glycosyltransferase family 2 protein [Spirosoma aureum]|uniref:Glycosyltransferase family 2 protein n=2 Tax=Spirosoma aureum TaxID=2692134 RepID=A0A6G9B022_9BACT|nr:glycosyltransferase family 2 protein [Spirosoma aureum]
MSDSLVSVVVPLYNEADNVRPLLERIREALSTLRYELILVDDGSRDATVTIARQFADNRTKLIVLARNYGQTTALAAGVEAATGEYIVTLDGDLQNDPADIPVMLKLAQTENWDVVAGNRANRQDGFLLRKIPSRIANALIRRMTGVYLKDYGCTLKIFRREVAQKLGLYGELHRFIPVLAAMQGSRMTQIDVRHHPRIHGVSKYGLGRIGPVLNDLLVVLFLQRYFRRPMRLFGPVAAISLLLGVGVSLFLLVQKLFGEISNLTSWLILIAVLLLGGLNLLAFGFIAEIQMRTYFEAGHKPTYRIREVIQGQVCAD